MSMLRSKKELLEVLGPVTSWRGLSYLVALAFSLAWIPDGIAEIIFNSSNLKSSKGWIMLSIAIVILFFLWISLRKKIDDLSEKDIVDINEIELKPQKVLVMTLSPFKGEVHDMDREELRTYLNNHNKLKNGSLRNWAMPMIAVYSHLPALKRLFVFVTTGDKGSKKDAKHFETSIKTLGYKNTIDFLEIDDPNNMEKIQSALHRINRSLKEDNDNKRYRDSDIVYDITSGTVLFSSAMTLFAVYGDRLIQYVNTNTYKTHMYNNALIPDEHEGIA